MPLFFDLLCVAVGNSRNLRKIPTADEWMDILELSKKHALVAIAFAGVQKIILDRPFTIENLPKNIKLQWLGLSVKIAHNNKRLNAECSELCRELLHDGLKTMVLKGQSNLKYYPENLRECRTTGDIDLWVRPYEPLCVTLDSDKGDEHVTYSGKAAVVEYARMMVRQKGGDENLTIRYHHVDLPILPNVDVEAHFLPMYLNNPIFNKRLQNFFEVYGESVECQLAEGNAMPVGTASFNAVYQLTHIYKHLFEEGVGLRQMLDYYFVLRALHSEQGEIADKTESMGQWAESMGISVLSNTEIRYILRECGLMGFAGAVMYVLASVFEPYDNDNLCLRYWQKRWPWMICEPDEMRGKHLLDEILLAGNFGKYDSRKGDLSCESSLHKFIRKTMRNLALAKYYPQEALWEPAFRVYHLVWRKFELWRF